MSVLARTILGHLFVYCVIRSHYVVVSHIYLYQCELILLTMYYTIWKTFSEHRLILFCYNLVDERVTKHIM